MCAVVIDVAADWSWRYDLDDFAEIESSIRLGQAGPSSEKVVPVSLQALPARVSGDTLALIEFGDDTTHPINPANAQFRSRSEVVFRVSCDLARANCIAGVLINPAHGISASVLEKSRPAEYALRQADRATAVVGEGWPDASRGHPRATFRNAIVAVLRSRIDFGSDQFRFCKLVMNSGCKVYH